MTDPERPLPSLDDRLRDQHRILQHLAEHTGTSNQTMKSNFQIAEALGLDPEGVRSALMALVEKGHVKVPVSNYGGVAAHITAAGQDFIQHGPSPTGLIFITQVQGDITFMPCSKAPTTPCSKSHP
ncbi:winged helix-turn-helix domain-containing protein [Deinococcus roseus]|uniref:HTH marR-type domain-containing protein n=1 Tax=Deinococcus roseus TaxID=392414 RepID=A0ABQ2D3G6_9DEIO|nr:winged helix-turn-helix domain-containing protein [Deinococcus roseus]GGJ43762.1 hypothetical protein GCM10008938_32570 [Deinococcus roseus]